MDRKQKDSTTNLWFLIHGKKGFTWSGFTMTKGSLMVIGLTEEQAIRKGNGRAGWLICAKD